MGKNVFVFVVCGACEHIDTLHFSLKALQKFSENDIIVVTDPARNEIPVVHNNVINVATPETFNHHQASIYLKTGLSEFLPRGNKYCYLDTDVVAVSAGVDSIFGEYKAPVTFANDHCLMDRFSPSAIACSCATDFIQWQNQLKVYFEKYKDLVREPENLNKKMKLLKELEKRKKNKIGYFLLSIRFNLSRSLFKLDEDTYLDKKNHVWIDKDGHPILYELDVKSSIEQIQQESNFRCVDGKIWTIDGKEVFDCRCNHLQQRISKDFGVTVTNHCWQHWNGGVFLFDDASRKFLGTWHNHTMTIFNLPDWKTRDQGTLIATVWQMGLQNHVTLDSKYNLIADYGHKGVKHLGGLKFELNGSSKPINPYFVHVYHHWADKTWDVWQQVELATGLDYNRVRNAGI